MARNAEQRKQITAAKQQKKSVRLSHRHNCDKPIDNATAHYNVSGFRTEFVPNPLTPEYDETTKMAKKRKKTGLSKNAVSESNSGKENNGDCLEKKRAYVKKKKKECTPLLGGSSCEGWSKEQDIALHNAYYKIKPLPNFWKQIAKLVPGKSSKECFDRFYSAFPTPPVSQPRSRIKGSTCESPIRPFADDVNALLRSAGSTSRRSGSSKQKILLAHKTVRKMLRRSKNADKEYETDLFSAVETFDPSSQSLLIPISNLPVTPDNVHKPSKESTFWQTQSAKWQKSLSRFSEDSHWQIQKTLVSPEVLKQVKNPALHDKYIDLLHSRNAVRLASAETTKVQSKTGVVRLPQTEAVSAAKAAVVAQAQEVLQQSRTNGEKDCQFIGYWTSDCSDEDCEGDEGGEAAAVVAQAQQVHQQSRSNREKDCQFIGCCISDCCDEECEGNEDGGVAAMVAQAPQVLQQSRINGENNCQFTGYWTSDDFYKEHEGDGSGGKISIYVDLN
ncbi:hypothetical protein SUGI_0771950 [Cryptomeria japonica]|uniref:uncharacterized protein LOC131047469 n=1 Tax=Cryptomeria japonica TaxID=3369 RepID=UPI00241486FF|nr:uncharacterized protein LOC131047469 [Cryptomeria japonica]GLJ37934.1 hypothetical protein SUGI_0771950 [Cryptomeria japonica]